MKHLLSTILLALVCASTFAQTIGKDKARGVAEAVLGTSVTYVPTTNEACRLFNADDGQGFVIVGGDDAHPAIIAYSHECAFNIRSMHPSLQGLMEQPEAMQGVPCSRATMAKVRRAGKGGGVARLCKTSWGQGAPYNTLCPQKDGKDCPVGCVATAMAQIMRYYEWPAVGTGKNTYASGIPGVGVLSSNFAEHQYDWASMCLTTDENLASTQGAEAVAQLCYDCGIASRMSYDPEGSGTHDDRAMRALYTYFGYKASTLNLQHRDCYATQEEWDALLRSYLDKGQPVMYAGYDPKGGGHEFIIDGYDDAGMFHVNWGWDGQSNGYYSNITLQPSRSGLSFRNGQTMVCGFEPDELGTDKTPQQWRIYMAEPPEVTTDHIEVGKSFTFQYNLFYNYSNAAQTWTLGVALCDLDGNQLAIVSSRHKDYTEQLLSYYGYNQKRIPCTIPTGTPDGCYTLRAVFRQKDYSDFVLPSTVGGDALNNIPLVIIDGIAYFDEETSVHSPTSSFVSSSTAPDYYDLQGRKIARPASSQPVRMKVGAINHRPAIIVVR